MILMIDNYDSFTYNIVQYLGELGAEVAVHRNDQIDIATIEDLYPSHIIISPGPCTPNEAGVSMAIITHFAAKLPILGVCLGHQCIAQVFGGDIIHAKNVMHGKVSAVHHNNQGVFHNLKQPLDCTRYHSLVADKNTLPDCLEITAWTQLANGECEEIMGIKHKHYKIEGVQFHPESIMSQQGHELLNNFLNN